MAFKTRLLIVTASMMALLLPGCFSNPLSVKQYSIKQEAPAKASRYEARASGASYKGTEAGASGSSRIEKLDKKNQDLRKRLDLFEQRLTEVEKKLKISR